MAAQAVLLLSQVIVVAALVLSSCDIVLGEEDFNLASPEKSMGEEIPADTKPPPGHLLPLGEHASASPNDGIITELDYMISGKDFYEHFVRKRRPVVFRGAAKDWPATKNWSNEDYMKEHYKDVLFDVELGKTHQTELQVRKTMTMGEFLDRYKKETLYLDSPFPQSKLIGDLRLPFCMQCEELYKTIKSAHLLFSSGNTSSCFHHDGYENLLVMVSGTKTVLLINHTHTGQVYSEKTSLFPGVSSINPEKVDLVKHPMLADVPFHKVVLEPGDILYNPQFWWHQVRSHHSPNIAVSVWFLAFEDFTKFVNEEDFNMKDIDNSLEAFSKAVNASPISIECKKQNPNIRTASYFKSQSVVLIEKVDLLPMNTGQKMPLIGFGTAGLLGRTADAVTVALEEGYRLIDSAQAYNESGVGIALKSTKVPREDLFIVSKIHPKYLGYESSLRSVDQSLTDLGVDYIDLMLIHSPDCDDDPESLMPCDPSGPAGTWQDTWRALEAARDDGKVRAIGVSNFELHLLEELMGFARMPPAAVQNAFDPFMDDADVKNWCHANGVVYMSASTLGAAWERDGMTRNPILTEPGLRDIAMNHDCDVARVVLRWAIDQNVVVLPRSRNPDHIATNFRLGNVLLSPSDVAFINSLRNGIDLRTMKRIDPAKAKKNNVSVDITNHVTHEVVEMGRATLYISSDDSYIYAFDATTGKRMWEVKTADETGSSCAFNGDGSAVYCGADDGLLRALDSYTGALLWAVSAGRPITSSPCVSDDGTVFVGSRNSKFYAISPDGDVAWTTNLTASIWASPVLHHGIVYIGVNAYDVVNLFALDAASGGIVWSRESVDGFVSSPRLSTDKTLLFVCDVSGNFEALFAVNGSMVWHVALNGGCQSSPVVASDGHVFIATELGNMYSIDGRDGSIVWTTTVARDTNSSPCLGKGDIVYVGAGNGTVSAMKRSNGDVVWSRSIGSGIFFSSPRLANNNLLYIGTVDGPLYALNAETGEEHWKAATQGPIVGTALITREHAVWYD